MSEVVIPTGQSRDGWIWMSVNGQEQWVKAGEPTTDLDATELEVLGHAMISYTILGGVEPRIVMDFVNGSYLLDGEATTVAAMFDNGAAGNWGDFSEADIVAGQGVAPSEGNRSSPTLKGEALARALAEATIIAEFAIAGGVSPDVDMHSAGWEFEYALTKGGGALQLTDFLSGSLTLATAGQLTDGAHRVAFTFADGRIAGSMDGRATQSMAAVAWSPAPAEFWFDIYNPGAIRSIAIYPVQDDANLQTLSALS